MMDLLVEFACRCAAIQCMKETMAGVRSVLDRLKGRP